MRVSGIISLLISLNSSSALLCAYVYQVAATLGALQVISSHAGGGQLRDSTRDIILDITVKSVTAVTFNSDSSSSSSNDGGTDSRTEVFESAFDIVDKLIIPDAQPKSAAVVATVSPTPAPSAPLSSAPTPLPGSPTRQPSPTPSLAPTVAPSTAPPAPAPDLSRQLTALFGVARAVTSHMEAAAVVVIATPSPSTSPVVALNASTSTATNSSSNSSSSAVATASLSPTPPPVPAPAPAPAPAPVSFVGREISFVAVIIPVQTTDGSGGSIGDSSNSGAQLALSTPLSPEDSVSGRIPSSLELNLSDSRRLSSSTGGKMSMNDVRILQGSTIGSAALTTLKPKLMAGSLGARNLSSVAMLADYLSLRLSIPPTCAVGVPEWTRVITFRLRSAQAVNDWGSHFGRADAMSNRAIVCQRGIRANHSVSCNGAQRFIYCDGLFEGSLNASCSRIKAPDCVVGLLASHGERTQLSCRRRSFTAYETICECDICSGGNNGRRLADEGEGFALGVGAMSASVVSELAFIATSAPPPTSLAYWKDASFVFGYMLFLYISLGMSVRAESKSDKEKKKSSEEGKSAQRADTGGSLDSATSSGVATRAEALCQDALTTYINSLFYGAFDAKCGVGSGASGPSKSVASVAPAPIQDHRAPPPQPQVHHPRASAGSRLWAEISGKHLLLRSLSGHGGESLRERRINAFQLAVEWTILGFITAAFYSLNHPSDDGTCATYFSKSECEREPSPYDPEKTVCVWQLPTGIDGPYPEGACLYDEPVIGLGATLAVTATMVIFSIPLQLLSATLFDRLLRAPTAEDVRLDSISLALRHASLAARRSIHQGMEVCVTACFLLPVRYFVVWFDVGRPNMCLGC